MNFFIEEPIILILSLVALFLVIASSLCANRRIAGWLWIIGFILVVFNITYTFLLGVELEYILCYILFFELLSVAFAFGKNKGKEGISVPTDDVKDDCQNGDTSEEKKDATGGGQR